MQSLDEIRTNAPPKASHYCYKDGVLIYTAYKHGAWRDMQGKEVKQGVMKPIWF